MKKHKLIGLVISVIGVIAYATGDIGSAHRLIGMLGLIVGVAWFIFGRIHD